MSLDGLFDDKEKITKELTETEPSKEKPKTLFGGKKAPKKKATPKTSATPKNQKKAYVIAPIGEKGTGKTKLAGDFSKILSEGKKMLYFDSESKSDKVLNEWFDMDKIEIINFTKIDLKTGKTLKDLTLEDFEKEFVNKWIPKIKSGLYEFLVIDKGNVFWKMGEKWYYKNIPKPKPAPFNWGEIYALVLEKIFDPIINICRHYNVNTILCFNTKGDYRNDKLVGVKGNLDAGGELEDAFDYYIWLEMDYEKYFLKHPLKPFWRVRDEDTDVTDYIFNREFILDGTPIKSKTDMEITREFKRYVDFMDDSIRTTRDKQKPKIGAKKGGLFGKK